jgi:hypothetical protein
MSNDGLHKAVQMEDDICIRHSSSGESNDTNIFYREHACVEISDTALLKASSQQQRIPTSVDPFGYAQRNNKPIL